MIRSSGSARPSKRKGTALTNLLVFDREPGDPEIGAPTKDRIVDGEPVHRTWNLEEQPGGLYAGLWESTPGAWRVSYTEWEFCQIVSGHSVLTEDGGSSRDLRAGDALVIRPGFCGVWSVLETTRKTYVIKL